MDLYSRVSLIDDVKYNLLFSFKGTPRSHNMLVVVSIFATRTQCCGSYFVLFIHYEICPKVFQASKILLLASGPSFNLFKTCTCELARGLFCSYCSCALMDLDTNLVNK